MQVEELKMYNCSRCGAPLGPQSTHCNVCGTPVQDPNAQYQAQQQQPMQQQPSPMQPPMPPMPPTVPPMPSPVQQPPMYGQMPPPPPAQKKNKAGMVIAIVTAALSLLILAAVVLFVFVLPEGTFQSIFGMGTSSSMAQSEAPSSRSRRQQDSEPETSRSEAPASEAPQSTNSLADMQDGFIWVREPYLEVDEIRPISGAEWMPGGFDFMNVTVDGLYSTFSYDGTPIFDDYDDLEVYFCDIGHVHGLPQEVYDAVGDDYDFEAQTQYLYSIGFPFEAGGDHGGGGELVFLYMESDGSLIPGFLDFGQFTSLGDYGYTLDDLASPEFLPVISSSIFDENWYLEDDVYTHYGLAGADGEILLPIEYNSIENLHTDIAILEMNGYYGYYDLRERRMISDAVWQPVWTYFNGNVSAPGYFNEGLCPATEGGMYGFLGTNGQFAVPPIFEGVSHVHNGTAWVKVDGLWGLISFD